MWSKLLHTAMGHVQKLNDCKESEWQANGLLWECGEALRGKLCGCTHCLLGDICSITVARYWAVILFLFREPVEITEEHQQRKGTGALFAFYAIFFSMLHLTGSINLFSLRWCGRFEKQFLSDYPFACIDFTENKNCPLRCARTHAPHTPHLHTETHEKYA